MRLARTLSNAAALGRAAEQYQALRCAHPLARALTVHRYIHDDHGLTFPQFECETERGHAWSHTGTAYGGGDDSYRGEGRVYCCRCGADGDA